MKNLIRIIKNEINDDIIVFDGDLKKFKKEYKKDKNIFLDNTLLCLEKKIYGENINASKLLQKENCKQIIKAYKKLKKLIWFLKIKNKKFDYVFNYDENIRRINNNDFLLESMLNIHFKDYFFTKTNKSIVYACDYLDKENALNNMCDFKDNKCAKHRAMGFNRSTGCCPSSCKFQDCCPCKTKNLACKLIMCDYLEKQGYYFAVQYIPILKLTMNPLERLCCWGMFFKSTKKCFWFMFWVRLVELGTILAIISLFLRLI